MSEMNRLVVHEIWCPLEGKSLDGKKIAIVGYSHYHGEGEVDRPSLTREVVESVIDGSQKHRFFTKIRDAFGFGEHKDFWERVYFFNYLPGSVGTPDKKYATGDEAQIGEAQARFLQFLEKEQPDKVFVFTRKGWTAFPESTNEELSGSVCNVLLEGSRSTWGTYAVGEKQVLVCGFPHPQYVEAARLKEEVQAFLRL